MVRQRQELVQLNFQEAMEGLDLVPRHWDVAAGAPPGQVEMERPVVATAMFSTVVAVVAAALMAAVAAETHRERPGGWVGLAVAAREETDLAVPERLVQAPPFGHRLWVLRLAPAAVAAAALEAMVATLVATVRRADCTAEAVAAEISALALPSKELEASAVKASSS